MTALLWLLAAAALANGLVSLGLLAAIRRGVAISALPRSVTIRPQLVIPVTGPLPDLGSLRAALEAQTVSLAGLTFAVESDIDPAFARVADVFAGSVLPWQRVVAGRARACAQKNRNLAAALRSLPAGSCIVLADADIVPQPHWLALLLSPIERGTADLVSGYRWPLPRDAHWATLLGTWLDRGVAALAKGANGRMLWGGSIAIAAPAAQRIDLPVLLEQAVTDDLALATAARAIGLRCLLRGAVLVPTPFAHGPHSLFAFGCRQYQLVRLYLPGQWWIALILALVNAGGSIAALILAARAWVGAGAWLALTATALSNALARRNQAQAAGISPGWGKAERRLLLLAAALPLVHLAHLAMIAAAADTRTIRWGRYRYRMAGRQVTRITPA